MPVLERALQSEQRADDPAAAVLGETTKGVLNAARLLGRQYSLVATNVPYLARSKQGDILCEFCQEHASEAKNDLATVFLERCLGFCAHRGTTSIVLPQNWLFLTTYRKFREKLLKSETWHLVARLGPGAFETISGEVVKAILTDVGLEQLESGLTYLQAAGAEALFLPTDPVLASPKNLRVIHERMLHTIFI